METRTATETMNATQRNRQRDEVTLARWREQKAFNDLVAESPGATKRPQPLLMRYCAKCKAPMVERIGRYGKFWGCSQFPKRRYTENR